MGDVGFNHSKFSSNWHRKRMRRLFVGHLFDFYDSLGGTGDCGIGPKNEGFPRVVWGGVTGLSK